MPPNKILAFGLGPIAGSALGLITIPVLATTFSVGDIGRYSIFQTTVSFFILLTTVGLDQAYVREFHEVDDKSHLLKACFLPGFIFAIAAISIATPLASDLSQMLYGITDPKYLYITLISIVVAFVSRFLSLMLRMQERGLAYSMSQIIPKAILLLTVIFLNHLAITAKFLELILSFLSSSLIVLLFYAWNTKDQWRASLSTSIKINKILPLLKFGAPLTASGLAYWALTATSSVALRSLSNFTELGIYSIAMSVAGVAAIFQSIFTVVWAPIVYKWLITDIEVRKLDSISRLAVFAACLVFLACGVFSWILDYILPTQYSNIKYLLPCAIVQPIFYTLSEITCVGITISRRTSLSLLPTVAALITNIFLSLWLVPMHGGSGALVANSIAFFIFFMIRTETSVYAWRQMPRLQLYFFTIIATMLAIGTALFASRLSFSFIWLWLAVAPIILWAFRPRAADIVFIKNFAKQKNRPATN